MRLFKMIANRKRKFKTWIDGEYHYGEYTISMFDTISEYIMFHVLNMNYYWSYSRGMSFFKVYDLDYLMEIAPKSTEVKNG